MKELLKEEINGTTQWMLVQGNAQADTLILYVQAGPGLPMMAESGKMEANLALEKEHMVCYWDQRGCGKSFSSMLKAEHFTLTQLADDIEACCAFLKNRFSPEHLIIIGFSIGASLALIAAARRPQIASQLILTGIDADIPKANVDALVFVARRVKSERQLRQVQKLRDADMAIPKNFQLRAKMITNAGGMRTGLTYRQLVQHTLMGLLKSKYYSLSDVLRTLSAMYQIHKWLLPELNTFRLQDWVSSCECSVHIIHGKIDGLSALPEVKRYYDQLEASRKTFYVMKGASHLPHLDDPQAFLRILKEIIPIH